MTDNAIRTLLLVGDTPEDAKLLDKMLKGQSDHDIALVHVETMHEAEQHLGQHAVDMILLDLHLPDASGLDAVGRAVAAACHTPLIVLAATDEEALAIRTLHQGIQDYLIKRQIETRELWRSLRYAAERKNMEEALLVARERCQVTLNCIDDGVVCADTARNITFLNGAAEVMTGWSFGEAAGRHISDVVQVWETTGRETTTCPRQKADEQCGSAARLSAGLLVRRDGFRISTESSHAPIYDGEGRLSETVTILRDISARKAAETRQQGLLATLALATLMIRELGGRITYWSEGCMRLYGWTAAEAMGQYAHEKLETIFPIALVDIEATLMSAGEWAGDVRQRTRDGRELVVSANKVLRRSADGQSGDIVLEALTDVTAQRHAEQALRESMVHVRALERSNDELDDFASIASHDLKEPLRGLSNNAAFLQKDYGGKLDEEGISRLSRIGFLCSRMELLIDDLLYFSRLRHQELALQLTDLNAVIHDIEAMSETILSERNAVIIIPHMLPHVRCDKTRITEVFRNLITNAAKYNDKPTKTIEIGYCEEVAVNHHLEKEVFYVKDNGMGIADGFQEDVFRIFKRLNVEDDEKEGSGVGLTFARKIVERHGGRIWLASVAGLGTTFYFTIGSRAGHDTPAQPALTKADGAEVRSN